MVVESDGQVFESCLFHLLAKWLWTCFLIFSSLSFYHVLNGQNHAPRIAVVGIKWMQTTWCSSRSFKKSIFIPTCYNRVYFILHSIILVETPLLSVIQAIVKDWAHSTDSIPGLTWFWWTSDMAQCSAHTSQSAGLCLPRWQRGPPPVWRCSDGCRLAHSPKRTCTWATRHASGSGSGSPTCPPGIKRKTHLCFPAPLASRKVSPPP